MHILNVNCDKTFTFIFVIGACITCHFYSLQGISFESPVVSPSECVYLNDGSMDYITVQSV